jgi:CubicO group peptidase (beta-lactamase class C family)
MKKVSPESKKNTITLLLFLFYLTNAHGQFPVAKPEEVGLSTDRLERLIKVMSQYTKNGNTAGLVTMIVRNGKVAHLESYGKLNIEKSTPMPTNAIFRIASQTKAVTSVAAMILLEQGKLLLSDPVSKYIPEFGNTTVAISDTIRGRYVIVPAKRQIKIIDILTHTSGIPYHDGIAGPLYRDNGFGTFFSDKKEPMEFWMRKLAALPFDAQPGEKYIYGYNMDLMGCVIEKISGMTLSEFFKKNIFEPLRMEDTYFFLPKEKVERLVPLYSFSEISRKFVMVESPEESPFVKGPGVCFSGGAGLVSTAEDYAKFLQMLLDGGELNGVRILSPKTVQLMTMNHVGDLFNEKGPGAEGIGFGFKVLLDPGKISEPATIGSICWGGYYGTLYWFDPVEKMVAILMVQNPYGDLVDKFRSMVYQSIVKSYQTIK